MTKVPPHPLADGREALVSILSPLKKREGFRHLWLGDTGMGKTYANNYLVRTIIDRKLVDIVLTVDDKTPDRPQYDGYYCANPESLRTTGHRLTEKDSRHVVFRGVALRRRLDESVEPASVAHMGWELVRISPCTVLLNIDELADATNGHQTWDDDVLASLYRKGRGVGLSVVAGTQLPQEIPRAAFGLSNTIGIFRLSGREVAYLDRYRIVTDEMVQIIPTLGLGEFLLYNKDTGGWNGKIYRF